MRTHTCGELTKKDEGKKVTLCGWADTIREHGKISFVDLRDRYGKTQIVIKEKQEIKPESVLKIVGEVKLRKAGTENKDLSTGEVEVLAEEIEIISKSETPPFEINSDKEVNEEVRLKYRYLDLRRESMSKNMEMRHKAINFIRDYLDKKDFLEVTTPMLTKSTPEGARDFIVPSRLHPGKFYALPQSPQQYKQLLMVAGIDKYFQIAPCFRDEDARADRSPGEFYQLDMEMSFVEQEDILDLLEDLMIKLVEVVFPEKKISQIPFPRLSYDAVMKKYGTDKPDLRKNKEDPNELAFSWIIDFPLFEPELAGGNYAPMHHMFTRPKDEDLEKLTKEDAKNVKSYQHDLVLNGFEVGGGSIRIHDAKVQEKIFDLIGFSKEQKKYFEHMLEAFSFGVPPHGGIAPGIDRLLMVLNGSPSLREVIAFPKNKEAKDVLMDAPSEIFGQQLSDVHIKLDLPKKKKVEKKSSKKN